MKKHYLAAFVLILCLAACGPERGRAVILISLDTLRQDHLNCYGYARDTSPNLDRFAREDAVLFESAYVQVPYTLPSHMSMLTGLYPEAHGVLYPFDAHGLTRMTRLSDGFTTLAESLSFRGFVTSAFTDGLFMEKRYGFDQGFDEYRDERNQEFEKNGFRKFRGELYPWIRDHADRDFFLFIHTYDTHSPYVPPEPFRSRFKNAPPGRELPETSMQVGALLGCHEIQMLHRYADLQDLIDLYDGCVAFVDDELGKLFHHLKELGLWEDALIVVTSDHGQCFLENGFFIGHGLCATNEETLIPLLLKLPGGRHAGRRVKQVVESVDILPTILGALDIALDFECQGQNLIQGLDENRWSKDYAFGISPNTGNNHYLIKDGLKYIEAVIDPKGWQMKLILKPHNPPLFKKPDVPYLESRGKKFYYDFEKDPLGVVELFLRGDRLFDLRTAPFEWKAAEIIDPEMLMQFKRSAYELAAQSEELGRDKWVDGSPEAPLSAEEVEQLIALGYAGIVDSGRSKAGLSSDIDSLELNVKPKPTDRSLLYRGDTLVWEVWRNLPASGKHLSPAEVASRVKEARACYEEFQSLNPDKASWVEWRLKFLDRASGQGRSKRTSKDKGKENREQHNDKR